MHNQPLRRRRHSPTTVTKNLARSTRITAKDLPAPYATNSAWNWARVVDRPKNAWPQAPAGFKVELFATGLDEPRKIITAPNGDIFLAQSHKGEITIFRGITADGKPGQTETFATGLDRPYGIAFYPPGPNPEYVYVGNTGAVVRFPYHNGDLKATGKPQHIADLPSGGGHWTRDIVFSPDGKQMFVGVGSDSNIDDPDTHPDEKNRGDILVMNPDGSNLRVYAYGIRNAGGGLAIDPKTGELWCSVNERDGLGDNLVPDYITHVQAGGFYGWPYYYIGGNQDPRLQGKHPELKDKAIVPDVLLQPHTASLRDDVLRGQAISGGIPGRHLRFAAWLVEQERARGIRSNSRATASDGKGERRIRRLPHRLRASQWTSLGTSGRSDGGSGWIVAGDGRWIEFDLASELHGEITES